MAIVRRGNHEMPDIPNVRLLNFVDTPASINFNASGEGRVQLELSNHIVDIREFRQVSVRVGSSEATAFEIYIGKISGPTLSTRHSRPIDQGVHTFNIVGPEMVLALTGGPPETTER